MTDDTLPPLGPHDHPEPQGMVWSKLEMQAIRRYAAAAVAAECERWRADAERYRWLRQERFDERMPSVQSVSVGCIGCTLDGAELDAAIDVAMADPGAPTRPDGE